jgi:phosphoserine phosphatase
MTPFVLVLVAPAEARAPLADVAAAVSRTCPAADWSKPRWLGEGEAIEVAFDARDLEIAKAIQEQIASENLHLPIDVCVLPAGDRRKRLLLADMDSTIIGQECIDEMAEVVGIKPQIAAITERAMRGELAFEEALRARLGLLAGISELQLEAVWRERVTLNRGARTLVATMRKAGATTALVSGGFTFFTLRVAKAAGFEINHANVLEMDGDRLTGQVVGPILGREAKLATLERLRDERKLTACQTMAVGDGANDLAMIGAAGLGVAYRAKPVVAAEADAAINHADLTALLYLQGYRRSEFAREG